MLSAINGCRSVHEPHPELIAESSGYRHGTVTEETLRTLLAETRGRYTNGAIYCESNQNLSLIVPVLARAFPEARYIWLIRNGLDVVSSAYAKQWYSGHSENHDRYEDCPPLERAWIDGRIEGDRCGDMSAEAWRRLNRFGRCCWYWSYVNRLIESDLATYAPHGYKLIRLEELNSGFPHLLDWMNLNYRVVPGVQRFNAAKRERYHWSRWSNAERDMFTEWCGGLMDRLYPTWRVGADWQGVDYQAPSAAFEALRNNYRLVKSINGILARNRRA
jgi:hypothetical protein